ncbi:MAG: hypothetical protein ACT4NU_00860 [Chromatiales bacterium]
MQRNDNPVSIERVCRGCYDPLPDRCLQPFLKDHLQDALSDGLQTPLSELYDKLIAALAVGDPVPAVRPFIPDRSILR